MFELMLPDTMRANAVVPESENASQSRRIEQETESTGFRPDKGGKRASPRISKRILEALERGRAPRKCPDRSQITGQGGILYCPALVVLPFVITANMIGAEKFFEKSLEIKKQLSDKQG